VTEPTSQTEIEALLEEHADLILAIEAAATAAAVAGLVTQLGRIQRDLAALWIRTVGALAGVPTPAQSRSLTRWLIEALRQITIGVAEVLRPFARRAAQAGRRQALEEIGTDPDDDAAVDEDVDLSPEVEDMLDQVDDTIQDQIDEVIDDLLENPLDTWDDALDRMSKANKTRGTADRAAAWTVNKAAADAVTAQAEQSGAHLVWIAERDACVACLAYSGITATPAKGFPIGRTYGDKPITPWPDPKHLPGPPLHPNCRCRLMLYFGHDTAAATRALPQGWRSAHVSYPDALRREADRSILRGWSLPSESERVRLRAAERLLAQGSGLKAPKTVKEYARRAIRRGGWPSRRVPTPPP
jgi:hypothetical protein